MHDRKYLRKEEGKTAFSQASEIVSSLYKHFLIFDLTFAASGMVLLLVAGYAFFATNVKVIPGDEYSLMVAFMDRTVTLVSRHSFVPTFFVIISYFVGLLTYDLADDFVFFLSDLRSKAFDWQDYEVIISRKCRDRDEAAFLISKFQRVHHFEVVNVSFLATFAISALIMAALQKGLFFTIFLCLMIHCFINYSGVAFFKITFTKMVYEQCEKETVTASEVQSMYANQKKLSLAAGVLLIVWALVFGCYFLLRR